MFREKIIDDSNFVPNLLLMLHPTQAVFLPRDFNAEAEQINNIYKHKNYCIEAFTCYAMEKHSNELEKIKEQVVR